MRIYTRTGDQGETDLLGGVRVAKDAVSLEVCGTVDELNALLGLARCGPLPEGADALLEHVQRELFLVGAELVTVKPAVDRTARIDVQHVAAIEEAIDRYEARLTATTTFLLPAGSRAAAVLHLARAVCRRAERRLVSLARSQPQRISPSLLCYVNRLSDLLYVLARAANAQAGNAESPC